MNQNSKFTKFTIAGAAENNSKFKTQNSKFKKESFCIPKRVLLHHKTSPFEKSPHIFRGNHTALYGFSLVSQSGKHYLCSINNKTVITLKLFGL